MKKLTRSRDNKILAGIMGGVGEYFDVDPTIIRLAYLLATLITGIAPGVIGYALALLIVPRASTFAHSTPVTDDAKPV